MMKILLALMAYIFAQSPGLHLGIAFMAQRSPAVLDEPSFGQFSAAHFTQETIGMPARVHRLNHTPNDEGVAFLTARRKQHAEVVFAILSSFVLVKNTVGKFFETLGTTVKLFI